MAKVCSEMAITGRLLSHSFHYSLLLVLNFQHVLSSVQNNNCEWHLLQKLRKNLCVNYQIVFYPSCQDAMTCLLKSVLWTFRDPIMVTFWEMPLHDRVFNVCLSFSVWFKFNEILPAVTKNSDIFNLTSTFPHQHLEIHLLFQSMTVFKSAQQRGEF